MAWQSLNDVYIPKSGGGDIEGSLSVSGNLVVNDGSGKGTTYDVASEISDLKSAWDSVSQSYVRVFSFSEFSLNKPTNAGPYGRILSMATDTGGDKYYIAIDSERSLYIGTALNGATTITWIAK